MSTNSALLFLKPHVANNDKVRTLVKDELNKKWGIQVVEVGEITSEKIDKDRLIDNHYYAIASKAVLLKPHELPVPADKFKNKFGISWKEALEQGLCLNAEDAGKKFGLDAKGLEEKWRLAKKDTVKFGGGFYCAKIDDHYVFNGFFMSMREQYVAAGRMIYYLKVEWNPSDLKLSWEEFRQNVLGTTDPSKADKDSIRGRIYQEWEQLGLEAQPDMGLNGIHGSASAFEALIERMNWCGDKLEEDPFGKQMLKAGVTKESIMSWKNDPQVVVQKAGGKVGFFDTVEDMGSAPTVKTALSIQNLNAPWWQSPALITMIFASVGAAIFYMARKSSKEKPAE